MDNVPHVRFLVNDRSFLALVKKSISQLSVQAGFEAQRAGEVDLIVAEMASNLVKHAKGGEILVRILGTGESTGLELISIDHGPGMINPERMLQDGLSTTKTLGHGLGSIKRLSDEFQIYSQKGWGTILLARIFQKPELVKRSRRDGLFRSLLVPKPGEEACGDGCYLKLTPGHIKLLVGDGLGHGPQAQAAVQAAIKAFRLCPDHRPAEIIQYLHRSVTKTRGLVGSVMVYDQLERQWSWCGVGNIATRLVGTHPPRNLLPYNGIIGMNLPSTLNDHALPPDSGQLLVMCSDGLQTRWDHSLHPFITRYDLTILAAALYKDYARQTDDVSIVVGRMQGDYGEIS